MTKVEFEIEFEGIYSTIKNYTNDHYILGYINSLRTSLKEEDTSKTVLLLNRLIHWYNEIMTDLEEDKYVYNKEQHTKTFNILIDYSQSIKANQQP